jgi:TRAP-type C4-dicarboxylate transport system substrate-binding protein
LLLLAGVARADQVVLRLATPAPEGSSWAREGMAFAREVAQGTNGRVKIKMYLGGIVGDERQMIEQVRRGRIDIIASGGMACVQLAPSMRIFRVMGLFQDRDEASTVANRMKSTLDEEFGKAGFVNLGSLTVGPDMLFTRTPVRSMADLRKQKLWFWDLDSVVKASMPALGIPAVPLALDQALRAFENNQVTGFLAVPTAALAFQWSAQARYLSDLRVGLLRGCVLVTTRALDALAIADQQAVRAAGAKVVARLEEAGRASDDALVGGLFEKQGVTMVRASNAFRADFLDAARTLRDKLPE